MPLAKAIFSQGHHRVIAEREIASDDIIFTLRGTEQDHPSKYSIQIADKLHLISQVQDLNDTASHWRYINHSCEPNARVCVESRTLKALRPIAAGEEITYNYCSTEFEMSDPFICRCESEACYGEVKGFRYLHREAKEKIKDLLSPLLKKHL